MKILIWLPFIPYPLNCGGNKAIFSMIDLMRKDYDVSIGLDIRSHGFIRKPSSRKMKAVEELKLIWPDVKFFLYEGQAKYDETEFPISKYGNILSKLKNLLTRKYRNAYNKWALKSPKGDIVRAQSLLTDNLVKYNPGFLEFVKDISNRGFDIIQVEMYQFLHLGYILPDNVKRIFIHHELRFVRIKNEMNLFRKLYANDIISYEQIKASEIASLKEYDSIITLTDTDQQILSKYISPTKIISSPAAILTSEQKFSFTPCKEFVFVGYGRHTPNADGLKWFANEIIPILRKNGIKFKVNIVGSWSESQRNQYTNFPEINFTGFVHDLSAFINGKISIIPLHVGSGMRIKILEAMNAKSPIISTSKGIEGINEPQHNSEYINADTPEDFAEAMISLINDSEKQSKFANNAYICFQKHYSLDQLYSIRKKIYS